MNKTCTECKAVKNILMFYRRKSSIDGRQFHCKVCHNNYCKEWRKNNPGHDKTSENFKRSKLRSRKYRHDMSDIYIRDILTMNTNLNSKDITDEIVELHKINLKIKRELGLTRKLKPI